MVQILSPHDSNYWFLFLKKNHYNLWPMYIYAHFLLHDSEVDRWLIPKQIITDAVKSKNWKGYLTYMNLRIVSKNTYMNLRIRNGKRHYSLASKVKDISLIQGQE